jgi:hypothetical protein
MEGLDFVTWTNQRTDHAPLKGRARRAYNPTPDAKGEGGMAGPWEGVGEFRIETFRIEMFID